VPDEKKGLDGVLFPDPIEEALEFNPRCELFP